VLGQSVPHTGDGNVRIGVAYLHHLLRGRELTALRLITLHNLTFMAELMRGIRAAIEAGQYEDYAARVLRGEAPY